MAKDSENNFDRRQFIGTGVIAAGIAAAACASEPVKKSLDRELLTFGPGTAPDGPLLKAGLVGCGGRGTGAAGNFLDAGPNLEISALADMFPDRLESCRQKLKERTGTEIPAERCFTGVDSYEKLLETDIDILIQATPPYFRPAHFEAAVQARKHVFMEKPVAVDPVGVKSILATAEKADAFNLNVATGTQFRHQKSFIETYNRVMDGAIGEIRAARGYSLRGAFWYKELQPEWSELEAMLRDWVNWTWLSGDHIVEQHIHGIDVLFWFLGGFPVSAVGMGGRARRVTGDQYDFFSFDYEMENGIHITSMCRQIDGCKNNISRWVIGSDGYTNCADTIFAPDGSIVWTYESESEEGDNSPYVQEHIDLITAIRTGNQINEAAETARSTLGAIMAREAAYTGLEVGWDELMDSDLKLGPDELVLGPVDINKEVPVPGVEQS
jgi:predicted dehydrogenase